MRAGGAAGERTTDLLAADVGFACGCRGDDERALAVEHAERLGSLVEGEVQGGLRHGES